MSYLDIKRVRQLEEERDRVEEETEEMIDELAWIFCKIFCLACVICTAAAAGYYYKWLGRERDETYYSYPDDCGRQEHNTTLYKYSLDSLKKLGDVLIPRTTAVTSRDVTPEDPGSWLLEGDTIKHVDSTWWYVSVDTNMSGTTGKTLRHWFEHVNCSDMYRWWHPTDHEYGIWIEHAEYRATSNLVSRQGKIHRVKERIGGVLSYLDIMFRDPCVGKDCDALKEDGVELILSADIISHEVGVGRVHVGRFVHTLRVNKDTTSTLHSRFMVGDDIHCIEDSTTWSCTVYESMSWLIKRFLLTETTVQGIFRHCKEEMYVLGRLIAKLELDFPSG